MANVKVPALLHKMSVSSQKAWYKKNNMELPAHLKPVSAAQAKKADKPTGTKELERKSLQAYGATKGTKVGEVGGEKAAGDKDTIKPLSPEQHSKIQAAIKAAKGAVTTKRAPIKSKADRLAFIKAAVAKAKSPKRAERFDVATLDNNDEHNDIRHDHDLMHSVGVRSSYNEEVDQIGESFDRDIKPESSTLEKLADKIDGAKTEKHAKEIISGASSNKLHDLKQWNMGLSRNKTHPYMKHIDNEIQKRAIRNEEIEQVNEMDKSQPAAGRDSDTPFPEPKPIKLTHKQSAESKLIAKQLIKLAKAKLKNEEVEQIDEVNSRYSMAQALTPKGSNVKAAVGTTARDKAATNKYARRISKLTGGEYSKQDVKDNLKSLAKEEVELEESMTDSWKNVQSMPKGSVTGGKEEIKQRHAYLTAVYNHHKKYGNDTSKVRKEIESLNRFRVANEEVEQVDEVTMAKPATHEDPLVTVHEKHGLRTYLRTHANLSTANRIFGTNVKHTDVHVGPVNTKSESGKNLTFAISKHHAKEVVKEAKQIDEEYQIKKTHSEDEPGEFDSSSKRHHYNIHKDGKKVGHLEHGTYFGNISGKLHGKDLPDIGNYSGQTVHAKLHGFLKSKTGQKWASNLHKYQKEEVEQIDEISHATLGKYIKKADKSADDLAAKGKYRQSNDRRLNVIRAQTKQIGQRMADIKKAMSEEKTETSAGGQEMSLAQKLAQKAMKMKKETPGADDVKHPIAQQMGEGVIKEDDAKEYDYEGEMAKTQLKGILKHAKMLHDSLDDDTNLPEWVQSKITLAHDYIQTASDYMDAQDDEGEDLDEALDPVGKEDKDVNNDGKVNGTDKYLLHRRAAIRAAINKKLGK